MFISSLRSVCLLVMCDYYVFAIKLFILNLLHLFSFLIPVVVQTPAEAPVIPPRHVSGGGGKVGTLTITWEVISTIFNLQVFNKNLNGFFPTEGYLAVRKLTIKLFT